MSVAVSSLWLTVRTAIRYDDGCIVQNRIHYEYNKGTTMGKIVSALAFIFGLALGVVGGAALLAYAYQAAGLYPPDDATIKFIARERGWLRDDV
jgi:hypothetical protein